MNNQLVKVLSESGVESSTANIINVTFAPFFEKAAEWSEKAKTLVVTDATQVREMKMAREGRLALKDIRVSADKCRKALKEDSLKYGKAVQGVYNVLEQLIAPTEKHCELQEKFVEIQEENRKQALRILRTPLVEKYAEFIPINADLGEYSVEEFEKLLSTGKAQYADKIELEQKAEEDRMAKEMKDRIALKALQEKADLQTLRLREMLPYASVCSDLDMTQLWKFNDSAFKAILEAKVKYFNQLETDRQIAERMNRDSQPIGIISTNEESKPIITLLEAPKTLYCFYCGSPLSAPVADQLECADCYSTFRFFFNGFGEFCIGCKSK